ncbi:hypothetical protein B7R21_15270 [Subtercola boreus]|uniref:Uncharacterized protein n=1 Tax=Subtercola boreus TaxID=120213 RepID=A0A3E0VD19_9MICO|nr:hypothetical protein [Subtercola boreus]RFA07549.1 hypothetical protein B7R21_15270 [Subtercola boreus]
MTPTEDIERGDWLRARLGRWGTVGGVAGTGFEAYTRVLHPVPVDTEINVDGPNGPVRLSPPPARRRDNGGRPDHCREPFEGPMPQLIWPADHAWLVASEIDWDSTIVAGPRTLIDALLSMSAIEALEVGESAIETLEVGESDSLMSDSDQLNPAARSGRR